MDAQTGEKGKACPYSQRSLEEGCILGNLRDDSGILCSAKLARAVCEPIVSEPTPKPSFGASTHTGPDTDSIYSFKRVQHLSALQASIRILPSLIVGTILNFTMGLFVHKIPPVWIVIVSSLLCAGSPLLMATIHPSSLYWANAFVAQLLQPISTDAIFTVGLILITEVFPEDTQALAGAVFNTVGQFGNALGLCIMQVIPNVVAKQHQEGAGQNHNAYMEGLRASFWAMFAFMILCATIGATTLGRTGKIGLKRD